MRTIGVRSYTVLLEGRVCMYADGDLFHVGVPVMVQVQGMVLACKGC